MVLCVIRFDLNIGSMKEHEISAQNGDVHHGNEEYKDVHVIETSDKGRVLDLILPVLFLIISCITFLPFSYIYHVIFSLITNLLNVCQLDLK